MRYATFDEAGNLTALYNGDNQVSGIPIDATELTQAQYNAMVETPFLFKFDGITIRLKTDQERADEIAARPPVPKTPEQDRMDLMQAALDDLILNGGGGL